MAAKAATIDYELENTEPPILSVEEAVERSSFFKVPSFLNPTQVGDFSKGIAEADQTIVNAKVFPQNHSAASADIPYCYFLYSCVFIFLLSC